MIVIQLNGKCKPAKNIDDNDPAVLPLYQNWRRKKLYQPYFLGLKEGIPFKNYDVPAIAAKFKDSIWVNVEMTSDKIRRRSFLP